MGLRPSSLPWEHPTTASPRAATTYWSIISTRAIISAWLTGGGCSLRIRCIQDPKIARISTNSCSEIPSWTARPAPEGPAGECGRAERRRDCEAASEIQLREDAVQVGHGIVLDQIIGLGQFLAKQIDDITVDGAAEGGMGRQELIDRSCREDHDHGLAPGDDRGRPGLIGDEGQLTERVEPREGRHFDAATLLVQGDRHRT